MASSEAPAGDAPPRLREAGPLVRSLSVVARGLARTPRALHAGLALLWTALILGLGGTQPDGPPIPLGDFVTNLAHAPLYGVLGLFAWLALARRAPLARWPALGARELAQVLAWVGALGLVDEWHQSMTPGRVSSLLDLVTDLVGASCVLWVSGHLTGAPSECGLGVRLCGGVCLCAAAALLATLG